MAEYRPFDTSRMKDWLVLPYATQKQQSPNFPPRGVCPWCGVNYRILKDNTMAKHKYMGDQCEGVGSLTANLQEAE